MAQLGLSDPLPMQYLHWVRDIATGSFGHSFFRAESVAEMIAATRPADGGNRVIVGGAVVDRRHTGGGSQRAPAEQPRSTMCRVSSASCSWRAGLLARHADRAGVAVLVRLPRAARRRVAVRRPLAQPADRIGPAVVSGWAGRLYRAHGTLEPVGGDPGGLRAHRARQGPERSAGDRLHALPNALLPVDHAVGHPAGLRAGRIDPGRARLRHPRARLRDVYRASASATFS